MGYHGKGTHMFVLDKQTGDGDNVLWGNHGAPAEKISGIGISGTCRGGPGSWESFGEDGPKA
jgi:hypothetical protein